MANVINAKAYSLLRRDALANWQAYDPVLRCGEICLVTDAASVSKMLKICTEDGKKWSETEYYDALKEQAIDQVFIPESEHAQSGQAVAEAVGEKQDKFAEVSYDSQGEITVLKLPNWTLSLKNKEGNEAFWGGADYFYMYAPTTFLNTAYLANTPNGTEKSAVVNVEYIDNIVGEINTVLEKLVTVEEG